MTVSTSPTRPPPAMGLSDDDTAQTMSNQMHFGRTGLTQGLLHRGDELVGKLLHRTSQWAVCNRVDQGRLGRLGAWAITDQLDFRAPESVDEQHRTSRGGGMRFRMRRHTARGPQGHRRRSIAVPLPLLTRTPRPRMPAPARCVRRFEPRRRALSSTRRGVMSARLRYRGTRGFWSALAPVLLLDDHLDVVRVGHAKARCRSVSPAASPPRSRCPPGRRASTGSSLVYGSTTNPLSANSCAAPE